MTSMSFVCCASEDSQRAYGLTAELSVSNPSEVARWTRRAMSRLNFIEARNMYMLAVRCGRSRIDDHLAASDPVTELSDAVRIISLLN